MSHAASILSFAAEGLGVIGVFAQFGRVVKVSKVDGLAAWTYVLGISANFAWICFSVSEKIYAVTLSNVLIGLMSAYILARIIHQKTEFLHALLASFVCGVSLIVMLYMSGGLAGWLAVLFNSIASLPQLVKVGRNPSLDGISIASQWYWFVAEILTLAYALMLHSAPLIVAGIRGMCTTAYIAAWAYAKRSSLRYNKLKML